MSSRTLGPNFSNGCTGFRIVVSSSINRKFGSSGGFGEDLTGRGLRRAVKTAEGVFGSLSIIQINKSIVILLFLGPPGARVSVQTEVALIPMPRVRVPPLVVTLLESFSSAFGPHSHICCIFLKYVSLSIGGGIVRGC